MLPAFLCYMVILIDTYPRRVEPHHVYFSLGRVGHNSERPSTSVHQTPQLLESATLVFLLLPWTQLAKILNTLRIEEGLEVPSTGQNVNFLTFIMYFGLTAQIASFFNFIQLRLQSVLLARKHLHD